jgi:hypothetical protein
LNAQVRIARQEGHADFPVGHGGYVKLASIAPVDLHAGIPRRNGEMPAKAEADPVTPKVVETRPPPDAGRAAIRADDPPCADLPSPDPHGRTVAGGSRTAPEQFHAVPCGLIRQQPMQHRAADCQTRAFGEIRRHRILQSDEMDPLQRESGALRELDPQAAGDGKRSRHQAFAAGLIVRRWTRVGYHHAKSLAARRDCGDQTGRAAADDQNVRAGRRHGQTVFLVSSW